MESCALVRNFPIAAVRRLHEALHDPSPVKAWKVLHESSVLSLLWDACSLKDLLKVTLNVTHLINDPSTYCQSKFYFLYKFPSFTWFRSSMLILLTVMEIVASITVGRSHAFAITRRMFFWDSVWEIIEVSCNVSPANYSFVWYYVQLPEQKSSMIKLKDCP